MTKITIDIPEDLERKANMLKVKLSILIADAIKRSLKEMEEITEFERIVSKSKGTEKDAEDLSNEIKEAVWKRHSKQ